MHSSQDLIDYLDLKPAPGAAKVLVFTSHLTERLRYTCEFIFGHVLKLNHEITDSMEAFSASTGFRVNYSYHEINGAFTLRPSGFLDESEMMRKRPDAVYREGQVYFFNTSGRGSDLDHDLFSSVFYFISRHEEWQDFQPDRHLRFEADQALLSRENHLTRPVVDQWILEFGLSLRKFYPNFKLPERKFKVLSTIDVDNVFAFKTKSIARSIGGAMRDAMRLDAGAVLARASVLAGAKKDPFDIYEELIAQHAEWQIPLVFFFLVRSGTKYDRTLERKSAGWKHVFALLKKTNAHIGLHPSYQAAYNGDLLREECHWLSSQTGRAVQFSRQHYLRFDIRKTPEMLMEQGIQVDFTMGFASAYGFRAGTSMPFYYYDFKKEKARELVFVPFCAMDGAWTVYKDPDPRKALTELLAMAAEVRNTAGLFSTVFHERSFDDRLHKGWGTLYRNLHLKLRELQAL